MAILGTLLKRGIRLRESLEQDYTAPFDLQKAELRKLLIAAKDTYFGRYYYFKTILNGFKDQDQNLFYNYYKSNVPIHDYNSINDEWWSKSREGIKGVSWPGKVKYYALSSGTSGAPSKYIPVTKEALKSMQRTGVRQLLALSKLEIDSKYYETDILMVGGSTDLKFNGTYFEGDLSGITTGQIPIWLQGFAKPGKKIAKAASWEAKLEEIVQRANDWNVGVIVGVPAWIQLLMERIIEHYHVKTIHDIWPNLKIFVHGGVSFKPYKRGFERLLGEPIHYMETYLASEGFIAFQDKPNHPSMKLVLNNGIFYEFIPFTNQNFDRNGQLVADPEVFHIEDVKEGQEYALLLSTNAGAWRYLIGDVIEFTNKKESEIIIKGRTKHFLSLCGEHLSLDNMNEALELTASQLDMTVKEFTVCGEPLGSLFAHRWYIGTDDPVNKGRFRKLLDENLKQLNDDYRVERSAALKELFVDFLPSSIFYSWMRSQGKAGGQHKFPRVLNEERQKSWNQFIANKTSVTI
ncbi:MAG: GH3 auxin-responsive promoter family protein [Reichenbachiella sp.]|uniref:GH3 family domain-containing protein n=1 Tax=Reichenbachiella sp. TaxID=2184521 RepID=UPI0029674E07|nr:GH3 auxin-responsive promoter family protein [Reichenbachiella sp.]MDW3210980.1 GH3 auxin-responsive promoter family protein [Reichenbachiella sp.]